MRRFPATTFSAIRGGTPQAVAVWALAIAIGLLIPFLPNLHNNCSHSRHDQCTHAHSTGVHDHGAQSDSERIATIHHSACHASPDHTHTSTQANTQDLPDTPPPSRPAERHDCPTCLELAIAGKLTNLPPCEIQAPVQQPVATALPLLRPTIPPATTLRTAQPRGPPTKA